MGQSLQIYTNCSQYSKRKTKKNKQKNIFTAIDLEICSGCDKTSALKASVISCYTKIQELMVAACDAARVKMGL